MAAFSRAAASIFEERATASIFEDLGASSRLAGGKAPAEEDAADGHLCCPIHDDCHLYLTRKTMHGLGLECYNSSRNAPCEADPRAALPGAWRGAICAECGQIGQETYLCADCVVRSSQPIMAPLDPEGDGEGEAVAAAAASPKAGTPSVDMVTPPASHPPPASPSSLAPASSVPLSPYQLPNYEGPPHPRHYSLHCPDARGSGALRAVSGDAVIDNCLNIETLGCSTSISLANQSHKPAPSPDFVTLVAPVALRRGKWYYEVTICKGGLLQIGWADGKATPHPKGLGVGDDAHSWAFDGSRKLIWHGDARPSGASWRAGDVLCCALDCEDGVMSFGVNGVWEPPFGTAFVGVPCFEEGLMPAISMQHGESLQVNFGSERAEHSLSWAWEGGVRRVWTGVGASSDGGGGGGGGASPTSAAAVAACAAGPPTRAFAYGPPPGFAPIHYAFTDAANRPGRLGRPGLGAYAAALPLHADNTVQDLSDVDLLAHHLRGYDAPAPAVRGRYASGLYGGGRGGSEWSPHQGPTDISPYAARFFGRNGSEGGTVIVKPFRPLALEYKLKDDGSIDMVGSPSVGGGGGGNVAGGIEGPRPPFRYPIAADGSGLGVADPGRQLSSALERAASLIPTASTAVRCQLLPGSAAEVLLREVSTALLPPEANRDGAALGGVATLAPVEQPPSGGMAASSPLPVLSKGATCARSLSSAAALFAGGAPSSIPLPSPFQASASPAAPSAPTPAMLRSSLREAPTTPRGSNAVKSLGGRLLRLLGTGARGAALSAAAVGVLETAVFSVTSNGIACGAAEDVGSGINATQAGQPQQRPTHLDTQESAAEAAAFSIRKLSALACASAELSSVGALGAAVAAEAAAIGEEALRECLLAAGRTLCVLYARRALAALLAAAPHARVLIGAALPDAAVVPLSPASLGLCLPTEGLTLVLGAETVPSLQQTSKDDEDSDEPVAAPLSALSLLRAPLPSLSPALQPSEAALFRGAGLLFRVMRLLSLRDTCMPAWEVASLAAAPVCALMRQQSAAACGDSSQGRTIARRMQVAAGCFPAGSEAAGPMRPSFTLPNAAGVWRFDAEDGALATHPTALFAAPLRAMLEADVATCAPLSAVGGGSSASGSGIVTAAAPTSLRLASLGAPPIPFPPASSRPHPAIFLAMLTKHSADIAFLAAKEHAHFGWRGEVQWGGKNFPSKALNLDGVPSVVLGQADATEGGGGKWDDRDTLRLPSLDAVFWEAGVMLQAVVGYRSAALLGAANDATQMPQLELPPGLAAALLGVRDCEGGALLSTPAAMTTPLAALLGWLHKEDTQRPQLPLLCAASANSVRLPQLPSLGAMHGELALALFNAWALGLRSANAGVKERAARVCAAALSEAVADLTCVERGVALIARAVAAEAEVAALGCGRDAAAAAAAAAAVTAAWAPQLVRHLSLARAARKRTVRDFLRALSPTRVAAALLARVQAERVDAPVSSLYASALADLHTALTLADALCPPHHAGDALAVGVMDAAAAALIEGMREGVEALSLEEGASGSEEGAGESAAPTSPAAELPASAHFQLPSEPATDSSDPCPLCAPSGNGESSSRCATGSCPCMGPSVWDLPPLPDAPWRLVHAGLGFSPHPGANNGAAHGPQSTPSSGTAGLAVAGDWGGVSWTGTAVQRPVDGAFDEARNVAGGHALRAVAACSSAQDRCPLVIGIEAMGEGAMETGGRAAASSQNLEEKMAVAAPSDPIDVGGEPAKLAAAAEPMDAEAHVAAAPSAAPWKFSVLVKRGLPRGTHSTLAPPGLPLPLQQQQQRKPLSSPALAAVPPPADAAVAPASDVALSLAAAASSAPQQPLQAALSLSTAMLTVPPQQASDIELARSRLQLGHTLRLVALGPPQLCGDGGGARGTALLIAVAGTLEIPAYASVIGVSGVLQLGGIGSSAASSSSGGGSGGGGGGTSGSQQPLQHRAWRLTLREEELLSGSASHGWDTRFGSCHPWYRAGTKHVFFGAPEVPAASGQLEALLALAAGGGAAPPHTVTPPCIPVDRFALLPLTAYAVAHSRASGPPLTLLQGCVPWPRKLRGEYAITIADGDALSLGVDGECDGAPFSAAVLASAGGARSLLRVPPSIACDAGFAAAVRAAVQAARDTAPPVPQLGLPRGAPLRLPLSVVGALSMSQGDLFLLDPLARGRAAVVSSSSELSARDYAEPKTPQPSSNWSVTNSSPGVGASAASSYSPSHPLWPLPGTLAGDTMSTDRAWLPLPPSLSGDTRPTRGGGASAQGGTHSMRDRALGAASGGGSDSRDGWSTVISAQGFTSGVHYWELQVQVQNPNSQDPIMGQMGCGDIRVGICERRTLGALSDAYMMEARWAIENGVPLPLGGGRGTLPLPSESTATTSGGKLLRAQPAILSHSTVFAATQDAAVAPVSGSTASWDVSLCCSSRTAGPGAIDYAAACMEDASNSRGMTFVTNHSLINSRPRRRLGELEAGEYYYGPPIAPSDTIGVRFDADTGKLSFWASGALMSFYPTTVDAGLAFAEIDTNGENRFTNNAVDFNPHLPTGAVLRGSVSGLDIAAAGVRLNENGAEGPATPAGSRRYFFPCISAKTGNVVVLSHRWVSAPGAGTTQAATLAVRDLETATLALAGGRGAGMPRVYPAMNAPAEGSSGTVAATGAKKRPRGAEGEEGAVPSPALPPAAGVLAVPPPLPHTDTLEGLCGIAASRVARAAWGAWTRWTAPRAAAPLRAANAATCRFQRVRARGNIFVEVDTCPAASAALAQGRKAGDALLPGDAIMPYPDSDPLSGVPGTVLGVARGLLWYAPGKNPYLNTQDGRGELTELRSGPTAAWVLLSSELPRVRRLPAASDAGGSGGADAAMSSGRGFATSAEAAYDAAVGAVTASLRTFEDFAAAAGLPSLQPLRGRSRGGALAAALPPALTDAWLSEVISAHARACGVEACNLAPGALLRAGWVASAVAGCGGGGSGAAPPLPFAAAFLARASLLLALNYGPIARSLPLIGLDARDEAGGAFPGLGTSGGVLPPGAAACGLGVGGLLAPGLLLPPPSAAAPRPSAVLAASLVLAAGGGGSGSSGAEGCGVGVWTAADAATGPGAVLRASRAVLLTCVKTSWAEALMGATTTHVAQAQDLTDNPPEFDSERNRKKLRLRMRPQTAPEALAALSTHAERLERSVTGQLQAVFRTLPASDLRRSVALQRSFGQFRSLPYVELITGEEPDITVVSSALTDQGGPYRAVFDAVTEEVFAGARPAALGGAAPAVSASLATPDGAPMLLPLLLPSANFALQGAPLGFAPGMFTFNPAPAVMASPSLRASLGFLGKAAGVTLRNFGALGLQLHPGAWRAVAGGGGGGGSSAEDLWGLDAAGAAALRLAPRARSSGGGGANGAAAEVVAPSTAMLASEGEGAAEPLRSLRLLSAALRRGDGWESGGGGGGGVSEDGGDASGPRAVLLALAARLGEGRPAAAALATGLAAVVPSEPLRLLLPAEAQRFVTGYGGADQRDVSAEALRAAAAYEKGGSNLSAGDAESAWLWEALQEGSAADRSAFLDFCTGRRSLCGGAVPTIILKWAGGPMFKASTCFLALEVPRCGTKEALREKLMLCIHGTCASA